tara:strand:- start:228 stop:431 length:204 start_codon:yes stop_codon:yes gene_type:complete
MNRYYESDNLIVRTDSFDTLKELSETSQTSQPKNKCIENETNKWKFILNGNNNNNKNLTKDNFPQLK